MKAFRLFLVSTLTLIGSQAYSQQILVRDVFRIENDLAARTSPRRSPDGSYCALLKINLPTASKIDFEGIVGTSDYSPGEYKVYVSPHTSRISFEVPGYEDGVIDFSSFGVDLDEKETYRVTMAFPHGNTEVGNLRILTDRAGQVVFVDGIPIGETPVVAEGLSVGTHVVSVANTDGYACEDVTVSVSKGVTSEISLKMSEQVILPFALDFSYAADSGDQHPLRKRITHFNGKTGLKDYAGRTLIPCEFDDLSTFNLTLDSYDEGYYVVLKDSKYGIYKPEKGLVVPCIYDRIYHPGKLLAVESSTGNKSVYQYIDSNGRVLTESSYPYIQKWPEELPALIRTDQSRYGYVDAQGRVCIQAQYQSATVFQDGYALVRKADGDYVLDRVGKETSIGDGYEVDFKRRMSSEEGLIHEGAFIVRDKNTGKLGYADLNGSILVECKFEDANPFENGFAQVRMNQKRFLCDKSGNLTALDGSTDQLFRYIRERRDGRYGLHLNGKTLLEYEYDRIDLLKSGSEKDPEYVISAIKEGENNLYDKDLKFMFSVPEEVSVLSMQKDIVCLQDAETYKIGYFKKNGEVIVPCICDLDVMSNVGDQSFDMVANGFAMIEIGDRRGFINADGIVVPFDYIASLPVDKSGRTIARDRNEVWYDLVFDADNGKLLKKTAVSLPKPEVISSQNLSKEEYVDLGLDVLWASRNLGSASTTGYGGYYTFKEALAKDRPQPEGVVYDLATITAGNTGIHLPSKKDITDLMEKCSWKWAEVDGVNGFVISGKAPGYEGNRIFLPAAGWSGGFSQRETGVQGEYWTSTSSYGGSMLSILDFTDDSSNAALGSEDTPAYSIRPVKDKTSGGPLKEARVKPEVAVPPVAAKKTDVKEDVADDYPKYSELDEKPSFEGGDLRTFSQWVNSRLEYPVSAKEYGIQGKVTLSFVVRSDGKVENVRVTRGVDEALDKEAVRVVSLSPNWVPGKMDGKPVSTLVSFPVIFQLR